MENFSIKNLLIFWGLLANDCISIKIWWLISQKEPLWKSTYFQKLNYIFMENTLSSNINRLSKQIMKNSLYENSTRLQIRILVLKVTTLQHRIIISLLIEWLWKCSNQPLNYSQSHFHSSGCIQNMGDISILSTWNEHFPFLYEVYYEKKILIYV